MNYNIFGDKAPMAPMLGKGTECIKLLCSQASKDMISPLIPMFFPALGAHLRNSEFLYPDQTWKETCGMMANLVAESGGNKGQLTALVEAICKDFRGHDEGEIRRLVEWQRVMKTRGANKEKPARPEVALYFPPSDVTNPAFLQNAMALESQGGRTQYINMPEVEMADRMCGGHRQVSQMLRNIYDRQRSGALRATADGVTGNPLLRVNLTISSTPYATRKFYRNDLFNGTFGRMVFSYKPRTSRDGRIPRQGKYNEWFYKQLQGYLSRLDETEGQFVIHPLNKLVDQMAEDMACLADLADDDVLWDVSKRSLVSAWKAGCVLWVLNRHAWTRSIGEVVEWLVYHDIWSKMQLFGDLLRKGEKSAKESRQNGPKNMLEFLPNPFNIAQLEALRASMEKSSEGAKKQVSLWTCRKLITYDPLTGLYTKTEKYLKSNSK